MRTKLLCLLVALILLPGCRSVKETLFPRDAQTVEPGVFDTTEQRQWQKIQEDSYNMGTREERKGG